MYTIKNDGQTLGPFKTMAQIKSFVKRNPETKAWTVGMMTDPAYYETSKSGIVPKEPTPALQSEPATSKSK